MRLQFAERWASSLCCLLLLAVGPALAGPEDNFPASAQIPAGWTTTPRANAGWFVASDSANGGTFSLKSGALPDDPTAPSDSRRTAAIQVGGTFSAGTISFAYRVSSEPGADVFEFHIDGQKVLGASGAVPWTTASFPLAAGTHVLKWVYDKDASFSDPIDAAWIDTVVLPSATLQQLLSTATAGTGKGTVVSSPIGITCGGNCATYFPTNSAVTLTAATAPGNVFSGWSGSCTGTNPACTVVMGGSANATANFTPADDAFPLSGQMPAGWVNGAGSGAAWKVATDSTWRGSYSLKSGTVSDNQTSAIQFSSAVSAGSIDFMYRVSGETFYDFFTFYIDDVAQFSASGEVNWTKVSVPVAAGSHVFKFAYRKDSSTLSGGDAAWIDAVVLPAPASTQRLNVTGGGPGAGTVISATGINCGSVCSATFATSSTVTLTASPAAGNLFTGWSGACSGTATTCQVVMSSTRDVTANFWVPGASGTLDVDASVTSTRYDALTDGITLIRYLFGVSGPSLVAGSLGATATRTDPDAISKYLDGMRTSLDIDGDGKVEALSDGLLVIRYMFGLRDDALLASAVGPSATRTTAQQIQSYIQSLMP